MANGNGTTVNPMSTRVANGAAAAGGSAPIAVVLIWALGLVLTHWGITIPPEIAVAMGSGISTAAGFIGGYMTREFAPAPVVSP